jgi:hypothetical protein
MLAGYAAVDEYRCCVHSAGRMAECLNVYETCLVSRIAGCRERGMARG